MKRRRGGWVMLCVVAIGLTRAGAVAEEGAVPETPAETVTVVTSERLTYDGKNRYALFEKDVVVTDPQLQLTADKLILRFDENGEASAIEAEGNVHITQGETKSVSGVATYDVETGKIVLTDKPRVKRGKDILQGDTITFWRDHNKLVCEPQARLIIYPQRGGARDKFLGE